MYMNGTISDFKLQNDSKEALSQNKLSLSFFCYIQI